MKKVNLVLMLLFLVLIFSSCTTINAIENKVDKNSQSLEQSNIKFVYFYRGFAPVKYDMIDAYPHGTLVIETDEDWHDFMDKYVPGIPYYVTVDYSNECLVYDGAFPPKDIYSIAVDIKGFTINDNRLEAQYIEYPDTGIANGIYAQNAEGYINCFVNIVKVNKKDIPGNVENIYHRK